MIGVVSHIDYQMDDFPYGYEGPVMKGVVRLENLEGVEFGDKVEIVKGINVTNDNVILISELPSGINR